jgi:hypothetical protein
MRVISPKLREREGYVVSEVSIRALVEGGAVPEEDLSTVIVGKPVLHELGG